MDPRAVRPPLEIGDIAPDIHPPERQEAPQRLSGRGGTPIVLAFHSTRWDPALAETMESLTRDSLREAGDRAVLHLMPDDGCAAERFGVAGCTAVFVVDTAGRIRWRHILGVDVLGAGPQQLPVANRGQTLPDDAESVPDANGWSRREFIVTVLSAGVAAAVALALDPVIEGSRALAAPAPPVGGPQPVTLLVNGQPVSLTLEPRVTLLDALREYAGLTGSKKGCDHGQCGACTVHIDGRRTLSCLTFAVMQQGTSITTIEGLAASAGATGDSLHPMQRAFIEHDGFQCGYCTSGQIMSATAMLHEPWGPGDDDVREAMSGNICRCGAYPGIVAAVQDVRRAGGQAR